MKTIIKNANVITMNNKFKQIEKLDIVFEDDKIIYIGNDYKDSIDKEIDATNKYILPGLINCHTHLGMSTFRASNDDYPLNDWLNNYIWPIEAKMKEEDYYYSTLVSCLELIKTGTTCVNDMYFGYKGVLKAIKETKIRGAFGYCLMDIAGKGKELLDDFKEMIKTNNNPLLKYNIGTHSLYTCSESYLKENNDIAKENNLDVHIHLAENKQELENIKNIQGKDFIKVLEDTDLINRRLIIAHGTFLDSGLDKLKGKDISICTNPLSNLNLGCGIANLKKYKDEGFNICIGTDGQGSGNNLNMFYHMSLVDYLQKGKYQDPTVMSSYDVLKMATINGAKALGLDNEVGSIEVGKKADLIILDLNDIALVPNANIISHIVHNAWFDTVDATIINGEILYQNKKFNLDIDIEELKNKIINIRERLIK